LDPVLKTLKNTALPSSDLLLQILYKLLLISNLIPGEVTSVVGPWWFYSTIVQLYMIFPFLKYLYDKYGNAALLIAGLLGYLIIYLSASTDYEIFRLWVLGLLIGQLPVFCFGIFLAANPGFSMSIKHLIICILIFIGSNFTGVLWPLSNLVVAIAFIYFLKKIFPQETSHRPVQAVFIFFGNISMYLFASHGFLRSAFYSNIIVYENSAYVILMAFVFLAISLIVAFFVKHVETIYLRIRNRFLVGR